MHKMCIEEFLTKSSPCYVERHSDSSDFETPSNVPVKNGSHKSFNEVKHNKVKPIMTTRRFRNDLQQYNVNTQYDRNTQNKNVNPKRQISCRDKNVDCISNYTDIAELRSGSKNREQTSCFEKQCSSKLSLSVRNKIGPCLSKLLRRSNENCRRNCKTQSKNENYYCDNAYCAYCEHIRTKKFNKLRKDNLIQPVYAITKNIKRFPFRRVINDCECVELSQTGLNRKKSDCSYEYSLSSGSEQEDINLYKHKKLMKFIMQRLEKRMRREYTKAAISKHQNQQFPSKMNVNTPGQIYVTSSCQTKISSSESMVHNKLPSNSSEFWDFLLQKIKYQIHKTEVTKDEANDTCVNMCNKDSCKFFKSTPSNTSTNKNLKPQQKSSKQFLEKHEPHQCCPTCNKYSSEPTIEAMPKKKNVKNDCECPKEQKSINSQDHRITGSQDLRKPVEDQHDVLTKTLADKYQAQILCIHNPPCVLINGCLNLPPPKASSGEGTYFYPVTQTKKSSFAQMCQKMKRSKQKSNDQAIQYHPPFYVDLQEMLPEFRTEKIVQSVCDHNPPCEVVRGCYKPRYNPTLQTSCVHVPMCPKVPECLLEQKNKEENACNHQPKCPEMHLCTRKYILLTAKENATTQVKPKAKIGCRHRPPCLMIPKCLAQAICGDWIAGNAIPGCVHQPSCDMIPACCRKQDKQSVSVPSQYPSASCRIV